MFQASLCPSSGALDRILLHLVFTIRCAGWSLGKPGTGRVHTVHTVHTACSWLPKTPASTPNGENQM